MDIEYGNPVKDKNKKPIGTVDHIIMDSWSGEPSKFVVRLDDIGSAVYFKPEDVETTDGNGVKLKLTIDEMERT